MPSDIRKSMHEAVKSSNDSGLWLDLVGHTIIKQARCLHVRCRAISAHKKALPPVRQSWEGEAVQTVLYIYEQGIPA